MDVFFINPEPLFLVLNRLVAYRAVPVHHAHCIGVAGAFTLKELPRTQEGVATENLHGCAPHLDGLIDSVLVSQHLLSLNVCRLTFSCTTPPISAFRFP